MFAGDARRTWLWRPRAAVALWPAVNVVFLSPNFPPQFHLFCAALRARGHRALGVGDCPPNDLAPEVGRALDEYAYVPDMGRYDDLVRALGYLTWRHGHLDRIESLNEYWLAVEARLREDFNVPGPRPAEVARHRSKTGMRELFRAAGVPCTEGERVTSPEQVRAFAARVGFPLVFKPDVGVGAAWTFRVDDARQLEETLAHPFPVPNYVVERFSDGELITFDGLTDREGNIAFSLSMAYCSGIMELVNEGGDVYYYTRRELPPGLEELGRKVVRQFELKERFFHLEVFALPGGGYRALEINLRPPGGFTTDMMNYTCDFDVYGLWARALSGESLASFAYERRYFCAHAARRHGRAYRVPHDELVRRLGEGLVVVREIPPVLSVAMGNVMYLVRSPDLAWVKQAIGWVEERA